MLNKVTWFMSSVLGIKHVMLTKGCLRRDLDQLLKSNLSVFLESCVIFFIEHSWNFQMTNLFFRLQRSSFTYSKIMRLREVKHNFADVHLVHPLKDQSHVNNFPHSGHISASKGFSNVLSQCWRLWSLYVAVLASCQVIVTHFWC